MDEEAACFVRFEGLDARCRAAFSKRPMNNRLYVGNLPFAATEDDLRDVFAECGEVVEVKIMMDRESGRSRGFGFVTMDGPESAKNAIERMNGADFDGRPLRVSEAEERRRPEGGGGFGGGRGGGRGGDRDRGGGGGGGRGGFDRDSRRRR
jgi:RNA recognition motif-containing protein